MQIKINEATSAHATARDGQVKILHVLQSMAPAYGGPVQALRTYAQWLAEAGEDVTVITTDHDVPSGRIEGPLNTPIQQDGYTLWRFATTFHPYAYSSQMGRWLRQHIAEFDVVHIHGLYRYPPLVAARLARAHRIPYIMRPHGSLDPYLLNKPQRRGLKRIHERLFDFPALNNASAIHFTTQDEKTLVNPLNFSAPSVVIPIGLNATLFGRPDLDGKSRAKFDIGTRPLVLFLGRLAPKKGLDISIKAFARVHAEIPDAVFVIAGPDNDGLKPQIEKWLEESGVQNAAIFAGMVSGDDRISLLRDADIFVLQSYTENFGISVVEASAAGTPVVISDKVNLWPDIVKYEAGLVTTCNSDDAGEAMLKVLKDKTLGSRLSKGGQKLVAEQYSRQAVVTQLLDLYASLKSRSPLL